jgi:eukaryotic-like serine/threonine-protein kinase
VPTSRLALAAELGPGSRIGRYQLVAPIGAGGMGRVWVALDTGAPARRLVALKTTLGGAERGLDADFWAMLADEAGLASRIHHPNVCATYELGQERNIHYLVMEWSDGASLRDVLNAAPGKRLGPEVAAYIAAGVAAGLHAAHELTDPQGQPLGVVHRDVSPQNVLVSTRGHVKLADFGVAKSRGQQHRPTETGEVKGKLSYMAPEQVASKAIDRRADVFALGCVLYESVLGSRPFHGADALATMYKILEQPLTLPRSLDPSFPEGLEQVLVKALAKDPAARYQTAEELREALLEYVSSTRRLCTDKHVADLLKGSLGDELAARNRQILASAEQLRRGETDPARLNSPPPPRPVLTLTPEGGVERSVTAPQASIAGRRRLPWGSVLAGVAAMGALALFLGWPSPAAQPPASPPRAATLPSATPVEPSIAPPVAPVVESSSTVSAPPAPVSSTRRPGARSVPRVTPVATDKTATAPLAKPLAKKPRPIDRDNPFASP